MENNQISDVKLSKNLKLAPETIRIRDDIVEKYIDEPLDTLSSKLQSLISEETNTGTRLGILSARVEILRMRFAEITGRTYKKEQSDNDDNSEADQEDQLEQEDSGETKEGWMTLRILEASEVNGVRFPEGVKIDVHTEDAKKLLASKKAELLSMKVEDVVESDLNDDLNLSEEKNEVDETENDKTDAETSSNENETEQQEKEGLNAEELKDLSNNKDDVEKSKEQNLDTEELKTSDENEIEVNSNPEEEDTIEKQESI